MGSHYGVVVWYIRGLNFDRPRVLVFSVLAVRHPRFFYAAMISALSVIGSVIAINVAVDPYLALGTNLVGAYVRSERPAKITLIERFPHDGILIGNSRMAYLSGGEICGHRFFNAAFSGGKPEEFVSFLNKYITNEKIVVLGLDFEMFNALMPEEEESIFDISFPKKILKYSISLAGSVDSIKVISRVLNGEEPVFMPDGSRNTRKKLQAQMHISEKTAQEDYEELIRYVTEHRLARFEYSEYRLRMLAKMRDVLSEKGVHLVTILPPINQDFLSVIEQRGLQDLFLRWKRDVKEILGVVYDFSVAPYSERKYFFRFDPVHFLPDIGREIISSALEGALGKTCAIKH